MSFGRRFTQEDINRLQQKHEPKIEKKHKYSAQPQEMNGIQFASKIELYLYNLLTVVKIPFEFQHEITAQDRFKYLDSVIRPIKIVVDFYLSNFDSCEILIDTKGMQTAENKLKWKLVKKYLLDNGREPEIHLPRTKEECDALVNQLLKRIETKKVP